MLTPIFTEYEGLAKIDINGNEYISYICPIIIDMKLYYQAFIDDNVSTIINMIQVKKLMGTFFEYFENEQNLNLSQKINDDIPLSVLPIKHINEIEKQKNV